MREYIKKFESASAANNYPITDIPFTTTITTNPAQNLVCNQENKKIAVDGQGIVSIVDARPSTITIHYEWGSLEGRWQHEIVPESNIEPSLQQDKVVNAPYILTEEDFEVYETTCHHYSSEDGMQEYPYEIYDENDELETTASFDGIDGHLYFGDDPNCTEYTISQNVTIYINIIEWCIAKDTPITLSDRTTKMIQDITYDDKLLVWDFDNAQYSSAKPLWIKEAQKTKTYWLCKLENGTEIKLVGSNGKSHRLFNYTDQVFEYPQDCVGKDIYTENGISKLVSCDCISEEVEYYNIITEYHMNLFANTILTSCRYNNIYDIEDMKFIKDDRNIVDFDEYKDDIPYEYYTGMRLGEQTIPVSDNIKYVKKLLFAKKKHVE